MPRYFFDVDNGGHVPDETGAECRSLDEVRAGAVRTLTSIASEEATQQDRHFASVIARDEQGRAVLSTTLTLTSLRLDDYAGR